MYWIVVMTSETGVVDAATGATTTGFDGAAVAALEAASVVGSTGFDSGAATFAAGAAGSVVAAGEFVFVSDADEFVTAAVALEPEPVPFAVDVTGSVVAGGASATVVAVTIAGATAVAVDVTRSGVDAGTSGAEAGRSGAEAVTLVADTASVEPEVTVALEAAGSDCVAATADSLSGSPGRITFVALIDGCAAVDCGWGAAPKPCGVPMAGAAAPALDPPLLLSADGLSWPWASAPLAPESAAAITPPLLPTRRPADSKQTTAAKRRCVLTMASSAQVTSLWLSLRYCRTARPSASPILNQSRHSGTDCAVAQASSAAPLVRRRPGWRLAGRHRRSRHPQEPRPRHRRIDEVDEEIAASG
jgi:hypothetical protein